MKKIFTIIFFALCSICCDNNGLHQFYAKGLLTDIPNSESYNYYIIIPHAGCPGCVMGAEELLLLNKNSNRYFFIITNYPSKKALKLKLGNDILNYNNVLLDSANKYYASFYKENIYPISIELEENQISHISVGIP